MNKLSCLDICGKLRYEMYQHSSTETAKCLNLPFHVSHSMHSATTSPHAFTFPEVAKGAAEAELS